MQPDVSNAAPVVDLSLEGPGPCRRLTVAFRFILAIPHYLWLWLLTMVAQFAIVIGWCCALFTGRLPAGIGEFIGKVARYQARVSAYGYYLLSDRYPPFTLDARDYAVELELPPLGRLSRAAVLFRLVLLVPAAILATLVGVGAGVAMVVVWLIVLVAGRMPRSIFEALSAVLRYQSRFYAFAAMLTSEYPKKLLGDAGLAPDAAPAGTPAELAESPMAPVAPPTAAPRITRLVLSKAGKRLVVLFVVLGVVLYGGFITAAVVTGAQTTSARDHFVAYDRELGAASGAYQREAQACAIQGGLPCLQTANEHFADAIARFRRQLNSISFPARALPDADALDRSIDDMEQALRHLADAPDGTTYQQRFAELQSIATDVNQKELALADALLA